MSKEFKQIIGILIFNSLNFDLNFINNHAGLSSKHSSIWFLDDMNSGLTFIINGHIHYLTGTEDINKAIVEIKIKEEERK